MGNGLFDIKFTEKECGMALDYRELEVWQMSMELCEQVYGLVRQFPSDERYALGDQLRRAAVSIPSNIAEGNGRDSKSDYARFLSIARGSLFEVQTQLELAERLNYVTVSEELKGSITRISKMLYSMARKLRT
jgi:four helix bundle protein